MKQNKPLILTDYLSVGEENALTAKTLSKYLGLSERDITIQINALRKKANLFAVVRKAVFGCLLMTEILSNLCEVCRGVSKICKEQ